MLTYNWISFVLRTHTDYDLQDESASCRGNARTVPSQAKAAASARLDEIDVDHEKTVVPLRHS